MMTIIWSMARPSASSIAPAVDRLFSPDWRMLSVEERTIDRYDLPKSAWEVVLEKIP